MRRWSGAERRAQLVEVGRKLFAERGFEATSVTWLFQWFQEFILKPQHVSGQWAYAIAMAFSMTLSTMMFYFGYRYVPGER